MSRQLHVRQRLAHLHAGPLEVHGLKQHHGRVPEVLGPGDSQIAPGSRTDGGKLLGVPRPLGRIPLKDFEVGDQGGLGKGSRRLPLL